MAEKRRGRDGRQFLITAPPWPSSVRAVGLLLDLDLGHLPVLLGDLDLGVFLERIAELHPRYFLALGVENLDTPERDLLLLAVHVDGQSALFERHNRTLTGERGTAEHHEGGGQTENETTHESAPSVRTDQRPGRRREDVQNGIWSAPLPFRGSPSQATTASVGSSAVCNS